MSFLHEKAAEWGTPNQVIKSLCQSPPKITAEQTGCECGHPQNCQNADEIASTSDNLSVELDSQAGEGGCNNDIEVKRSFIGTDYFF